MDWRKSFQTTKNTRQKLDKAEPLSQEGDENVAKIGISHFYQ